MKIDIKLKNPKYCNGCPMLVFYDAFIKDRDDGTWKSFFSGNYKNVSSSCWIDFFGRKKLKKYFICDEPETNVLRPNECVRKYGK